MHQIFEKMVGTDVEFSVRVSYLELYNEELFDLLSSQEDTQRLRIFEDSARKVRRKRSGHGGGHTVKYHKKHLVTVINVISMCITCDC